MVVEELLLEEELREWVKNDSGPMVMGSLSATYVIEQARVKREEAGGRFDWRKAVEHWSHLVRVGVIATLGDPRASNDGGKPHTFVTARGRNYLTTGEVSPHHAGRYLADVSKRVSAPDPVVVAYVTEAVSAWQAQLYRACVVMMGCAYEKIVISLAAALATSPQASSSSKLAAKMRAVRSPPISSLFDDVSDVLAELDKAGLLGVLADGWERRVAAVFEHTRSLRNNAGHPTGADVSAKDAEAVLLTFPEFYARLDALTHLATRLATT